MKSYRKLKKRHLAYKEYRQCIKDLIEDDLVLSMVKYIQHSNVTCLDHSLHVSYTSFLVSKYLNLDFKSVARGSLLHDFFLYDWHTTKIKGKLHGFNHPKLALHNSKQRFRLNSIEMDIIEKHMWPLTFKLPKYKESFVVLLIDKYCSLLEIVKLFNATKFTDLYR